MLRIPRSGGVVAVGVVTVGVYAWAMAWAFETQSYNVWGGLLICPLILAVNVALVLGISGRRGDGILTRIMLLGLALKVLGVAARYVVAFVIYGGVADAVGYNNYASYQYVLWRQGLFVWDVPQGSPTGTFFMNLVTTAVYTVVGPSPIAGFFVFGSFAYWGVYLFYRAFEIGVPGGDRKRYALLVFLLPSLLYWPSSIGKEAFLMLCIGAVALGGAKFFARERGAALPLVLGLAGTLMVRPHFAALLVAGLFAGQLFRPRGKQAIDILYRIGGIAVMVAAGALVIGQSATFLGIDDPANLDAVNSRIDTAGMNTEQGGSKFTPVPLTSPLGLPASLVTVLFRPFPWEAHNLQVLVSAVEGAFLIVLLVASWRRFRELPRILRQSPYVTFVIVYALLFVWAFSSFGNFGILARQRVLVMPLFLVLAALPPDRVVAPRRALPETSRTTVTSQTSANTTTEGAR